MKKEVISNRDKAISKMVGAFKELHEEVFAHVVSEEEALRLSQELYDKLDQILDEYEKKMGFDDISKL